ncbi:MAG: dephospho-CoA kinase [Methylibium sp.]|uniref:dephospho-CoA kinase n=1 Tax=Methylibium sp. TaxID=2067992 RepID=UPI0017A34D79|nr:dephospho-CoA kinase [Methylibium sp.]MBA2723314.1 dephospho-CoA kinase [Methylibium sp.]MBA3598929.1 dephospho-CoA kinase [Methylibium sp.]
MAAFTAVRRIGLTGGIGSGKSTVAMLLQQCGAHLVDTDAIARALTAPEGAAIPALRARFGPESIDAAGAMDRAWMRERAFADGALREALEALLHPLIGAEAERQAGNADENACVVFDVPLLVESGRWRARVDRVLVVDCSVQQQIERVVRRSAWSSDAVLRVIAQQAPRELRRAAADAVIDNSGEDLAVLKLEVQALWRQWVTAH